MNGFGYNHYLIAFLLFWLAHFTRQTLLYLHLWQAKQYRWDRLKDQLREKPKILFPRSSFTSGLVFLSFFVFPQGVFLILASVNFLTWGSYALWQIVRKRLVVPKATRKTKLFFLCFWLALLLFSVAGFSLFPYLLPPIVLFLVVVFPALILSSFRLMEWPVDLVKRRLAGRASIRRSALPGLRVIGITGSFGKTSVKDFLYHFLAFKHGSDRVVRTSENTNTYLGLGQTILREITEKHLFFVCEMGAYRRGEIKQAAELVKPSIGVLTGLNDQHLSLFGSRENIISAKYELIESLPTDGLAVFNGDNRLCRELYEKTSIRKIIVSTSGSGKADWRAIGVKTDKDHLSFRIEECDRMLKVNLIGQQNVVNILLAAAVALQLGLTPEELAEAAESLPAPAKSPRIFKHGPVDVIDASYSSNTDGARAHLEHLKLWKGRRILITPGFIELGPEEQEAYRQLGQIAGQICHSVVFTGDRDISSVEQGVRSVGGKTKVVSVNDPSQIFSLIEQIKGPDDAILIEGRVPRKFIEYLKES